MASAYVCNGTPSAVAINLNGALDNVSLDARSTTGDGNAVSMPLHAFPIVQEPKPGSFAMTGSNKIHVMRGGELDAARFDVEVDANLEKGLDLYFFFLGQTLLGQDENGRAVGIVIKALETVKKQIQTGEEAAVVRLPPAALESLEEPGGTAE